MLAFLDEFAAMPAVAVAKERSFALADPRPGDRILDAGCGTGSDAVALARAVMPGGEVIGIDSSQLAVATARERAAGRVGVRFERADVVALPFPEAFFSAVRADRVLLHLAQPVHAVRELVRVTRSGGRVVLSEVRIFGCELVEGRARHHHEYGDLLPALPIILKHLGVHDIVVERQDSDVELSDDVLAVLGARGSSALLSVVLTAGTVAA